MNECMNKQNLQIKETLKTLFKKISSMSLVRGYYAHIYR